MWTMIVSLQAVVDGLQPAFTQPSYVTTAQLLLGWIMCLGRHTLRRVGQTVHPDGWFVELDTCLRVITG